MRKPNQYQWAALPDILTIEQVALIMQKTYENIRIGCVKGDIPAFKVGKSWRISKRRLMAMCGEEIS